MGSKSTRGSGAVEACLGPDLLTAALREQVREMIVTVVETELTEVLAVPYERNGARRGYRHGRTSHSIATGLGRAQIALPRARLLEDGREVEWRSHLRPRYQRRARAVDAALLGAYLTGANQRRIQGALAPLLRHAPLSKSAISRLVGRLKSLFEEWRRRSLCDEQIVMLYLDAIALRVRVAQKVISAPVLVVLGVRAEGQKVVLDWNCSPASRRPPGVDCWRA